MNRPALAFLCLIAVFDLPAFAQPDPLLDVAGDPLPAGAIARLGTTRYRLRGWHQGVFFSPDGNTVICKGEESVIRAFEVASGKVVWEFKDADLTNWTADQSPDGTTLAVLGYQKTGERLPTPALRVYDLPTRKPLWTIPVSSDYSSSLRVRFFPNGKTVVTTTAHEIRFWDARTGIELLRQKAELPYGGFEISRDGKWICYGYSDLFLWDWESGAEPRKIEGAGIGGSGLFFFGPDDKTVYAASNGRRPKAFDIATGKPVGWMDIGVPAQWVSLSPNKKLLAVGYYGTSRRSENVISFRDAITGNEIRQLPCGTSGGAGGAWSRDGTRFATITDNRFWAWDVKTGKVLGPDIPGHEAMISTMTFSPDGRIFTASNDHTIRAWDPATGKQLMCLQMNGLARGMALSPDGSLLAGSGLRNDFRIWEANGKERFGLNGHGQNGGLRLVQFSADGKTLISYGDDCYLRVWDTKTGKLRAEHRLLPHGASEDDDLMDRLMMMAAQRATDLGPDGNTFVFAEGAEVVVIDAVSGKQRFRFAGDPQRVENLALSPDGRFLAISGAGMLLPKPIPGQPGRQPNDHQVTIWDLVKIEAVTKFRVPGPNFSGNLKFSPNGRMLATSAYQSPLQLWNTKTGAAIGTVELPQRVGRVAFDATGKRLAVAFWDTTVVIYDLATVLKPAKKE